MVLLPFNVYLLLGRCVHNLLFWRKKNYIFLLLFFMLSICKWNELFHFKIGGAVYFDWKQILHFSSLISAFVSATRNFTFGILHAMSFSILPKLKQKSSQHEDNQILSNRRCCFFFWFLCTYIICVGASSLEIHFSFQCSVCPSFFRLISLPF